MGVLELLHRYDKGLDEEVDGWHFMSSPVLVLSILTVYLIFILKLGPALMKNVQAFKLKNVLLVYNLIQISYCTFIFIQALQTTRIKDTLVDPECKVERNREEQLAYYTACWHFLIAKIMDLLDTIFFVLRKKQNQITFLHVYHHAIMVFLVWFFIKYILTEEQYAVIGLLNSFVHMLMYTYYLISSLGPQYQKYLWWKKYMTTIQLIQFIIVGLCMLVIALKGCPVSRPTIYFTISQTLLFFYLFYRFYRRTYKAQQNKSKDK